MNTFEFTINMTLEASDREDAEDFLRDLLDNQPEITEYNLPVSGEVAVAN